MTEIVATPSASVRLSARLRLASEAPPLMVQAINSFGSGRRSFAVAVSAPLERNATTFSATSSPGKARWERKPSGFKFRITP